MKDKAQLEGLLEDYKNQYSKDIDENAKIKSIEYKSKLDIVEDNYHLNEAISMEQAKDKIYSKTQEAVYVEVKSGDTISDIADRNNISVQDMQKLNPQLDQEMKISPGDRVCISSAIPVLEVMVTFENTVIEDIAFETEYVKDSTIADSQRKTISEGVNGKQEVTYEIVLLNGNILEQNISNKNIIEPSVPRKVSIGTMKLAVSRSGSNFGVVSGGRLTSIFGTRIHPITGAKIFHEGIDIGASQGSSVNAYANGTVSFAGWKGGFGNFVEISHGNGLVTRYGHLSAIYVRAGQQVKTGQRIGAVGSTGSSTGPHLHFEVLTNGVNKIPLNYL
jgi:murein DD-endopeptidase MepM/ murein hydrolase activator NlpD